MRRSLVIALLLIVMAPLATLAWFGVRVARDEQERLGRRWDELLQSELREVDSKLAAVIERRRLELDALTTLPALEARTLRERTRTTPFVRQFFVRDQKGGLIYPSLSAPLTDNEREFLRRTRQLWTGQDVFAPPQEVATGASKAAALATAPASGFYTWYFENGLNLIYWRRDAQGRTIGAELSRVRLLADLMAELPVTSGSQAVLPEGRVELLDTRGDVLYAWGGYHAQGGDVPRVETALSPPLGSWKLRYFLSAPHGAPGRAAALGVLAGVTAMGLALAGLALYFYRESTRELRDAAQRVTFVNQVSHELKTPLTNIRMYAELLERELADSDPVVAQHLGVIIAESQRLSRLIGNVLTFARARRDALTLRRGVDSLDAIVGDLLQQFAPALAVRHIEVRVKAAAPRPVSIDRDAVTQIVANLVSNVEKYGAAGGVLEVETAQENGRARVTVRDEGPGIPAGEAAKIFTPFYRVNNSLTEGVSGAGIGLALARDLARLHGGDLVLRPGVRGACFELTLEAPEAT